jgi:hypothetical protein
MLISKMQTCVSDKWPLKKINMKRPFSNFDKSYFFPFLMGKNFREHFVTKTSF